MIEIKVSGTTAENIMRQIIKFAEAFELMKGVKTDERGKQRQNHADSGCGSSVGARGEQLSGRDSGGV